MNRTASHEPRRRVHNQHRVPCAPDDPERKQQLTRSRCVPCLLPTLLLLLNRAAGPHGSEGLDAGGLRRPNPKKRRDPRRDPCQASYPFWLPCRAAGALAVGALDPVGWRESFGEGSSSRRW
jgi:hypothetical protein